MMKIIQSMNKVSLDRALIYCAATIIIYALQFFYLCLQVIIRQLKLADQGSPLFIVYAFSDFSVFVIFLCIVLRKGAEANLVDE
jgi:hypothetical protein